MSLYRLINGLEILRMPMGAGDGESSAASFDPASVAQAALEKINIQEKQKKIEIEIAESVGNRLKMAEQQLEIERIRYGAAIEALEKQKKSIEEQMAAGAKLGDVVSKTLDTIKLSTEEQKQINALMDDHTVTLEDVIEKMEEFRSKQEISRDFARSIESSTGKLARNMGIAADFSKTSAGAFAQIGKQFLSGDRAANLRTMGAAFEGLINPINILGSLLDIAITKMIELDKAAVGLKVATGFANDFQSEMTAVASTTIKAGVTLQDSNAAFSSVAKTIKGFNLESQSFRENIATSTALMTKLGVSADTSAKNFDLLTKSFKMTGSESRATLESMAARASDLGLTAEQMGSEFNSAMGYLSSFGKEGIAAFQDLASQAGVTGLAISKMLDMTKSFDKFSEGAKKAATLNSVLGTSLSSMALMTMNPAERMKELRNQINSATGGVKNMTQAQKLFTAEAMGYSSVAEMMADLQASPAEMRERAALAKQQADIQARLANAMTELVPLMDRVSMAFQALATNEDAINALAGAFEFLIGFVVFAIENFKILFPIMLVLKGLSIASAYHKRIEAKELQKLQIETLKQIGANTAAQASQVTSTAMTTASTTAIRANTLSLKLNRIALAGTILSLVGLMAAFLISGSPQLYMMPLVMAGFVVILTIALKGMTGKAVVGALALALLAGAMALVFYGMAALVESITELFTTMSQSVDTMPAVIIGIFALGAAFLFLGYAASFSSAGIFMGLAALTAMFLLFKLTGTSMADMFGAGDEIMKIGTGIEKFGQGLNNIKSAVGEIKGAIGNKGLFAGSVSGDTSSLIMGDGVAVAKLFKNSKIEVDVKMPEISMPKVEVKVFIGNEELRDIIRKEVTRGQK